MTSREFIQNQFGNADGKVRWCSSIMKDEDGNIYSYGSHYPLLFKLAGKTFRNVAGYSMTTSKHIGWAYGFNAIDVELPRGFRLNSWRDDKDQLKEIQTALKDQAKNIQAQMDAKKRKDTQVYRWLESDLSRVNQALARVDAPEGDPESDGLAHLHTVAGVMALGDIFGHDQKESNDWKARMLKAGLEGRGLIMPEDWDQLTEDQKEARLNGAIEQLS